jgi:hypothetical protein
VVLLDGNVRQAPVGQPGMARIHAPQSEAPEPSCGLLPLGYRFAGGGHAGSVFAGK